MSFRASHVPARWLLLVLCLMGVSVFTDAAPPLALHEAGSMHDIAVGTSVIAEPLRDDPQYAAILRREFNLLTPEVALKWDAVRPDRDTYRFDDADLIIDFASAHGLAVRGHTLVWHRQLPEWLEDGSFDRDALLGILREHIETVVTRYRSQVVAWDVVNEAFNDDGTLRDSLWLRVIGPDYIEHALRWTHAADPDALLFLNDYNNDQRTAKSDAIYAFMSDLRARGVPLHGIGMQMHLSLSSPPALESIEQNMARFAALGVQIHITEMDVAVQNSPLDEAARLDSQAALYAGVARLCVENDACTAFVTWGITDRHTWIPEETGQPDAPLLFDRDYRPKPAFALVLEVFQTSRRSS